MKIYSNSLLNQYSQSLTYDDISLIPTEISRIKSRTEKKINCEFLGLNLSLPVISSTMDTVTGIEMAKALTVQGCLGILNRFDSSLNEVLIKKIDGVRGVSIALNASLDNVKKLADNGYIICIDTANANNNEVLKKNWRDKKCMWC